jgi:hypothetical protein
VVVLRVVVCVVLAGLCTGAAAAPTDPPPVTSFACIVGDVWTFHFVSTAVTGKPLNGDETFTRTDCGERRVIHPSGALVKADVVSDADGNVYSGYSVFNGLGERFNKPIPLGRLPLAPGKTWGSSLDTDMGGGNGFTGTGHWRLVDWEMVTVPAGTYLCLRQEMKMDLDFLVAGGSLDGTFQETSWYSPDARSEVKAISSDSFGDSATRELTAVTLK